MFSHVNAVSVSGAVAVSLTVLSVGAKKSFGANIFLLILEGSGANLVGL